LVVYQGRFGGEAFPSVYQGGLSIWGALPQWSVADAHALLFIGGLFSQWLLLPAALTLLATFAAVRRNAGDRSTMSREARSMG
jgi:hypothetical protein